MVQEPLPVLRYERICIQPCHTASLHDMVTDLGYDAVHANQKNITKLGPSDSAIK